MQQMDLKLLEFGLWIELCSENTILWLAKIYIPSKLTKSF
jgi:hypothetical protein